MTKDLSPSALVKAIAHALKLSDVTHGVITVLVTPTRYDFGCAYIDSPSAVVNVLPRNYFAPHMSKYRATMWEYQIVPSHRPEGA